MNGSTQWHCSNSLARESMVGSGHHTVRMGRERRLGKSDRMTPKSPVGISQSHALSKAPRGGLVRVVQCPSPPGGDYLVFKAPRGVPSQGHALSKAPRGGTSQGRTVFKSSPGFVLRTVAQTASIFGRGTGVVHYAP